MTAKAGPTSNGTGNNKRNSARTQQVLEGIPSNNSNSNSSRASEPRRANKPLMEKRRRARINQSLAVLKTLILDSAKTDNTKHSKLEKADILELTVRHFQRHRNLDTPGLNKYRAGYADCVREVQRYLETPDAQTMCVIEPGIRQRLLRHLESCVSEIDTDISPPAIVQHPQVQTPETLYKTLTKPQQQRMDYAPTQPKLEPMAHEAETDDAKIKLEADSSTAEEINNNTNADPRRHDVGARIVEPPDVVPQHVALPNNVIRMYDGNFVFVLPSHYVQLAAALGINLGSQVAQVVQAQDPNAPGTQQRMPNETQPSVAGGCSTEKPIDYSKSNEVSDHMWRPW